MQYCKVPNIINVMLVHLDNINVIAKVNKSIHVGCHRWYGPEHYEQRNWRISVYHFVNIEHDNVL